MEVTKYQTNAMPITIRLNSPPSAKARVGLEMGVAGVADTSELRLPSAGWIVKTETAIDSQPMFRQLLKASKRMPKIRQAKPWAKNTVSKARVCSGPGGRGG